MFCFRSGVQIMRAFRYRAYPTELQSKRRLTAAYHIGGFCEMLGVPEVLGLMSTSASGHYSSPSVGGILER